MMDEGRIRDNSKAFYVHDGTTLYSLKDLYGHLSTISADIFKYHVNAEKNDFANWIEGVHGDKFLAAAVRRAKTKEEMQKVIFRAMFR